ncbi:MAG TPA: hypothetical protein VGL99_24060 [Chloroflexota bacterium]|jgi:haloalkane dehalogenase
MVISAAFPFEKEHATVLGEHRRFLDALLEQLGVRERVTFVIHDWARRSVFA